MPTALRDPGRNSPADLLRIGAVVPGRRSYAVRRETPEEALADLNLLDYDFCLFTDELTGQDSVIYRLPTAVRAGTGFRQQ